MVSITDKVAESVISKFAKKSTDFIMKEDVNKKKENNKKVIFHKIT